jgi:hypothetical protein
MDKSSDFDFFIVTEKGRLWLCRSILAFLRKLMPGPAKKFFCFNYFIDTSSLTIPDNNIFTATEIAYLYPAYNTSVYTAFFESNHWFKAYYPNKKNRYTGINNKSYRWSPKAFFEKIFNGAAGDRIDQLLFRFMQSRWKKRYRDFDEKTFDLNIRTRKNVSKQHEKGYQNIVLDKYRQQIIDFQQLHNVVLTEL